MSSDGHRDYDLIVVGGGSGGLAGAFRAARHGARVALFEPGELGGTCVNVGCVPKKAMWLAADLAERFGLAAQLGFAVPPVALDWPELIVQRQRYIEGIHRGYRQRLEASGIVQVPSRVRLLDAHTVVADDGLRASAPHLLVATGARPQRPEVEGAELGLVSDDFFALRQAPPRVAMVGGGYVAVELASVLQALGSQVEMFVRGQRLLSGFDEELTGQLRLDHEQHGIRHHFGYRLQAVSRDAAGTWLHAADGGASGPFDAVFFATGRVPNARGIGLEQTGVALDERGHVVVDEYQNTSVSGVYAVGDVTACPALTPVAIAAARRLMDRVFGGKPGAKLDYQAIPTVVFAHPPLGSVGLDEATARKRHGEDSVRVYRAGFRPMLQALADSPQRSLFKVVCVGTDERVVGIHLLGEGADEILQGFAVALKRGITRHDLEDTVAIHPTSAEEVVLIGG